MRIIRVDQDKMLDKEWDGMVLGIWLLAIAGAAYRWSVEKKDGDVLRQNIRIDVVLRVWLTAKNPKASTPDFTYCSSDVYFKSYYASIPIITYCSSDIYFKSSYASIAFHILSSE